MTEGEYWNSVMNTLDPIGYLGLYKQVSIYVLFAFFSTTLWQ